VHDVDIFDTARQDKYPDRIILGYPFDEIEELFKHGDGQKIYRRIVYLNPEAIIFFLCF